MRRLLQRVFAASAKLCGAVCTQVAMELDPASRVEASERLVPIGIR